MAHLNRKISRRPREDEVVESVVDQVLGPKGLYEDWRITKTPEEQGIKRDEAQFLLGRMSKYHVIEQALRHIAMDNFQDAASMLKKVHEDLGKAIDALKG